MKLPLPAVAAACRIIYGGRRTTLLNEGGSSALRVALPELDPGPADESILTGAEGPIMGNGLALYRTPTCLAGIAVADEAEGLESAARDLYRRVFNAIGNLHLYRVWNFVPQINADDDGLENYRLFCRGRSVAFEDYFGQGFQRQLPAACAVGTAAGPLAIGFIAGEAVPRHFENPQQVPAFEYPRDYGPRSPSFARATSAVTDAGRQLYISGTASIRGHASASVGDLQGQIACTIENLRIIGEAAGAGPGCGADGNWRRSFKVYVRNAADYPAVREQLDSEFLRADDSVNYLRADICRADLLLEIDAVLTAV